MSAEGKNRTREAMRLKRGISYTYLPNVSGSGEILETRPIDGPLSNDGTVTPRLAPWQAQRKPTEMTDPVQIAKWKAYWEANISWWDSERAQEFRARTWR